MISINILVVDDNHADLFLFEDSIANVKEYLDGRDMLIDFSIKKAENGMDSLVLIESNSFDIAFIDIKMPKMSGLELLEKIKQLDKQFYTVMFTTSDYDEDIKKSIQLGANAYLLKSLDIIEFEENLKSILIVFIQNNFVYLNVIKDKYKNLKNE